MQYDLRTDKSAYDFILDLLNMTSDQYIVDLHIESGNDFETFWKRNFLRIKSADISNLKIMAFHVLGSLDDCKEIRQNGLMNLQEVLSRDTILSRLLKEQGIVFDIPMKVVSSGSKTYDIDYDHYRNKHCLSGIDEALKSVAHRVYYDYCVNGFMLNDNVYNYGTQIHVRPEFLMTLAELFSEAVDVEHHWQKIAKSYRIDFYAMVNQIHRFNFELDEEKDPPYEDWLELDDEMKIKKWMLSNAIHRSGLNLSDQYLYVRDDMIIPPQQIISYSEI